MLALVCVIFVALCLYVTRTTQRLLLNNASEYRQITAQKLMNQLDMLYDKLDVFAMNICLDEDIHHLMTVPNSRRASYVDPVMDVFATYMSMEPGIVDIALVNEDVHYSRLYHNEDLDAVRDMNQGDAFRWNGVMTSPFRTQSSKGPMLLFTNEIKTGGKDIGTLIITYNPEYFQLSADEMIGSYYLLANDEGIIYSFNCEEKVAQEIWTRWSNGQPEENISFFRNDRYVIGSDYSVKLKCNLLSTLDVQYISDRMRPTRILIWSMVVLVFLFMAGIFAVIVYRVANPLQQFRQIIHNMRESANHESVISAERLGGCSEIAEIGHEFSAMVAETDQLNRQVIKATTDLYEAKVARQQAELSFMRSQIDPHFLYNTLEVFRRKALERNAPELAEMSMDMARIFRYSTKGEDQVPLSDELEIVKSYVHLQRMRFQDRFQVFYSIAENTLPCIVAKMLIQPLAENAIAHGIEPKEDTGTLFIASRIENQSLIITVKDDGVGIPPDKLHKIQATLDSGIYDTSEHVGVVNTHARIRLQYGEPYGLSIDSVVGDGTTIIMRLPVITETGEQA